MKIIDLTKGFHCLIDESDYELVSQWKWSYSGGYARRQSKGKTYSMHRQILGLLDSTYPYVDHINGDKLDNRRENLRLSTYSQNSANRRLDRNNSTGFKGVSFDDRSKTLKYRAVITVNDKQIFLGRFSSPEDAALAYNRAAEQHFGEFAYKNEIKE